MNMNNLKIFIGVADAGGVTEAAKMLYITQPAVSKAIKNLEEELDTDLFYRNKRNGMILTDTGEKVLHYARQMMRMEEQIYQTVFLSKNMLGGTLKIAALPSGSSFFLIDAYTKFHEKYPQVSIELKEGTAKEVEKMVLDHEVEFGISFVPSSGLEYRILMEDEIAAITKEKNDIDYFDLTRTKKTYYACQAAWESLQPFLDRHFQIGQRNVFKIVSSGSVRKIASEGIGIGLQAKSFLSENDGYYIYPVKPQIKTDLALIAYHFHDLTPAASAFIAMIDK
ncbi:MAG: LysR family transcriptional regulator [Solobacterium sp.]|nr:LysR family transcriptional regulator [Solobacterium sp.]